MKNIVGTVLLATLLIIPATAFPAGEETAARETPKTPEGYRIGCGDILRIEFWQNENLTKEVVVLRDGTITMPLIGEVTASGKTLEELGDDVRKAILPYVPEPELSISVIRPASMQIYVIGRVNRPGEFMLSSELNVLQALAIAGGPNSYAETGKIRIFRREGDRTRIFDFDYDKVTRGKMLEQNIILERGDTIVVP
jgi:polysaccharide export outer membrane protein